MKVIKRYLSRESFEALMTPVGVIATFVGLLQAIVPSLFVDLPPHLLISTLALVLFITYLLVRPTFRLKFTLPENKTSIEIKMGDIFLEKLPVITADQMFSSDLSAVGEDSLMGQLVQKKPDFADILKLQPEFPHKSELVEPGTVIDLENDLVGKDEKFNRIIILACGKPCLDGTETNWSDLSRSLIGLWNYIRSKNISEVSIPVIGSGFSGSRLSHSALLQFIIYSFYSANNDRLVVRKLTIVVHKADYDWDSWIHAKRLLRGIGIQ